MRATPRERRVPLISISPQKIGSAPAEANASVDAECGYSEPHGNRDHRGDQAVLDCTYVLEKSNQRSADPMTDSVLEMLE
jgi:hypothetical protein